MSRVMGFIHDQLVAIGHSVDYLCFDDIPVSLSGRLSRFIFPLLVCRRVLLARKAGIPYDLINVHEPAAAAVALVKRLVGSPIVVVTSHGVEKRGWELALSERRFGYGGPSAKTLLAYPLTSLWQSSVGLRYADHIFCLNEEDRRYLTRWLNLDEHQITRIHPASDPIYSATAEGRDYKRANRLLFAGTWLKRKGIDDLIHSFCILAERYPRLELEILGGGQPEEDILSSFPQSLRSRITCRKTATEAETAAAFASANIYVLPSLFEGTPLTLIEAMMSGMPIVTTRTCGMKDVIRNNENGLLVSIRSPAEIVSAVERLLADEALRTQLGRAARADALENYVWERVAEPVRLAYERLCPTSPGY